MNEQNLAALQSIDTMIDSVGAAISYDAKDKMIRKQALVLAVNTNVLIAEGGFVSDFSVRDAQHTSSLVEYELSSEEYHSGVISRIAKLAIGEYRDGVRDAPKDMFYFEEFQGGIVKGTVMGAYLVRKRSTQTRDMKARDIMALRNHIEIIRELDRLNVNEFGAY